MILFVYRMSGIWQTIFVRVVITITLFLITDCYVMVGGDGTVMTVTLTIAEMYVLRLI